MRSSKFIVSIKKERVNFMFEMRRIGRKIAELRKEKDMTQVELADYLGISFQAVSNWERGNSMPDISKLPELASLFQVSIDELLEQEKENENQEDREHTTGLLHALTDGSDNQPEEFLKNNALPTKEFIELLPIMKPRQADVIFEKGANSFPLKELSFILPFINREVIDRLVVKYLNMEEPNVRYLEELAPFAGEKTLEEAIRSLIAKDIDFSGLAPFLRKKAINELALELYENKRISAFSTVAMFVSQQILVQVADAEYEKTGLKEFDSLAPFMDLELLNQYAKKAIQE